MLVAINQPHLSAYHNAVRNTTPSGNPWRVWLIDSESFSCALGNGDNPFGFDFLILHPFLIAYLWQKTEKHHSYKTVTERYQ